MRLVCAAVATLLFSPSIAHAQAGWTAVQQPGQPTAARVQVPGTSLRGVAVTCDRGRPLMAVRLATKATARAARGRLIVGAAIHEVGLARIGTSETWMIPITDPALLGRMAAGGVASLHVTGMPPAGFPLAGADAAFAAALASCYKPSAATALPSSAPTARATGGLAATDLAAIETVVRRAYAYEETGPSLMTPRADAIAAECAALQTRYDRKLGESESFGLCSEDAGALCGCQDMDEAVLKRTLRVTAAEIAPGRARAIARFALFTGEPATRSVTLELVKAPTGWKIDRVGSEQATQLDGIIKMRKALGLAAWTPPMDR
ncbi:hypothetical protein [Sphingomonas sp. M1-B02]|uniref:hypothetical protein n=1 Tax=Sphingomonas sp. M1-B02 TaxID=3114300 RepID=UPI0022406373|nr:hypothetical protein [Sphingomonas sp. S6-11]UZK66958.1 hypothetical protein OKW87_03765 [Sphingomonas sp. S6-11]